MNGPTRSTLAVGQAAHDVVGDRFDRRAKKPIERCADEVWCDAGTLARVTVAVVLGERVSHHVREPRLVDPGRVGDVISEDGCDIVVAGQHVDVVDRVVKERRIVSEPLPDGERIAGERVVVERRGIDRRPGAHATFSGKWHAVRFAVPPRSVSSGRSVRQRSCGLPAPGGKDAAGNGLRQVRQLALEPDPATLALERRVGNGHGREERDRVRVLRGGEDLVRGRNLDELPPVHHGNAVAHVSNGGEIVRDEQVGEAEPTLEVHEEVQDLSPHGDVERGHRLVAHDEGRIGGKCPRDRDALALPS